MPTDHNPARTAYRDNRLLALLPGRQASFWLWHYIHERGEQGKSPFRSLWNDAPWMRDAACTDADPEAWFASGSPSPEVSRVCGKCTVRESCLNYALDHPELTGIWGGTDERTRRHLRTARNQWKKRTQRSTA